MPFRVGGASHHPGVLLLVEKAPSPDEQDRADWGSFPSRSSSWLPRTSATSAQKRLYLVYLVTLAPGRAPLLKLNKVFVDAEGEHPFPSGL